MVILARTRLGSVPPNLGVSQSYRSSTVTSGYRPSYAAAPAHYFHGSTPNLAISSSSFARPSHLTTRYFDPSYPYRTFGTRLGKGYNAVAHRPTVYDDFYGESYIDPYGRDSWTAYKISDDALDVNDDVVYLSKKRDYEVLKDVNRQIARASSVPPASVTVRTHTVPHVKKDSYHVVPRNNHVAKTQNHVTRRCAQSKSSGYSVPEPKVRTTYSTVQRGSDLLVPSVRKQAREDADLTQTANVVNLRLRIADALGSCERQKSLLGRYTNVDKETADIENEVRAMKTDQMRRAKSEGKSVRSE